MWALALKEHTETERRGRGRWEDGTRGSCWVSVDGLTQFQGAQRRQNLISKRQIVILSSAAPVGWVHLPCAGCRWGGGLNRRRGPHYGPSLQLSKNDYETLMYVFEMHWNGNGPVGSIHKDPELVWTWSSGRKGRGRVNRLRQWCSCLGEGSATPILGISEASSCPFNPIDFPTSHSGYPYAHTLHCVWVCCRVEPPLLIVQHSNYKAVCTD